MVPLAASCVADGRRAGLPLVLAMRVRTMSRRVLRYEVPVDDKWHDVVLAGLVAVLHVAARRPDAVEFWAIHHDDAITLPRSFRVFGTGQPDVEGDYCGTAITAGGALVWHLFESVPR